jgi:predicted peptidase
MKDPDRTVGFLRKTLRLKDGTERVYQVWIPLTYDPSDTQTRWPTILFLHGAGECGSDGEKVLKVGLPAEIRRRRGRFDFIVVIPQSTGGWSGANEEAAVAALQASARDYRVDRDRIYLTGLSMGGFGSFALGAKYRTTFAAVVPICGGGSDADARRLRSVPIWIWHGDADPIVPVDRSRAMVEALTRAKAAELRYTEIPGCKHNAWDTAYADDRVYAWLLEHRATRLGSQRPVPPVVEKYAKPDAKGKSGTPAVGHDGDRRDAETQTGAASPAGAG